MTARTHARFQPTFEHLEDRTVPATLRIASSYMDWLRTSRADVQLVQTPVTPAAPAPLGAAPGAPSGLTPSVVSATQINLSWTDNSSNETGFTVQRATNSAFTSGLTSTTVAANSTSYQSTGLTAGTTYYFRVLATGSPNSAYSNVTNATTGPAAPASLTTSVLSSTQIKLTWQDKSSNETGFAIQWATNSAFTQGLGSATVAANATTYQANGLTAGTTYYFRVQANGSAASAFSNTASATTAPAEPINLSTTVASATQINLSWVDRSSNETGFQVERATNSSFTAGLTTASLGVNATSYAATGLTAGTTYYFRVLAKGSPNSGYSNLASATTAPAAPASLAATVFSSTQVNLSWQDKSGNETGFEVQWATNAGFTTGVGSKSVAANSTSTQVTGLTGSTTYYFRVLATGPVASAYSNTASVSTAPVEPINLNTTVASATQINLSWVDRSSNETGFQVERSTSSTFSTGVTTVSLAVNATSYAATGLTAGTTYYFRVLAKGSPNSGYSNIATATTPPLAATDLTTTVVSHNQINLNWQDKSSNESGFEVQWATNAGFTSGYGSKSVAANSTSTQVTGLDGSTTYYFRVVAVAGASQAAASNVSSATTKVAPAPTVVINSAWFDNWLQDADIRSLARSVTQDGTLDRNDMLAIFSLVRNDGTVTATELDDLRDIVRDGTSLGMADYVRVLAGKVVNGDAGNATFQGLAMGNLAAGSTGAQLNNLVGEWFLGLDRPVAKDTAGKAYSYVYTQGQLFVNGATYTDIRQGQVGDCYFLAALGEAAQNSPATIQNMFIDNGDNTYTVTFFINGQRDYVTVDRYLPVDAYGRLIFVGQGTTASSTANELWVSLAEKAYAQLNEAGKLERAAGNSYQAIGYGYIATAMKHITGRTTSLGNSLNLDALVSAFNAGQMIGIASKSSGVAANVVAGHAYQLVGYNAANQTFTLYNPWGNASSTKPATLTLTWAQLTASFSYFDATTGQA